MAKQEKNIVTQGMSGKIGGLVFRQVDGETIISQAPGKRKKEPTEKQKKHYARFQQATIYAKIATTSEDTKDLYAKEAKKQGISGYNVAVADYLNAPDINSVNLLEYTGATGSKIKVIAVDDFMVKEVLVEIYSMDGTLIEEGYAVNITGGLWEYTATQENPYLDGAKIVVSASDLPGNITTKNVTLTQE